MFAVAESRIEAIQQRVSGRAKTGFSPVELRFSDNWARLSAAFGMAESTGRVHAALFLSDDALSPAEVSRMTGLSAAECAAELERLHEMGVVSTVGHNPTSFVAEKDPWVFFTAVVRHRASREFAPLLEAIRSLQEVAAEAHKGGRLSKSRLQHITAFTQFVDQVSGMLETFGGSAGSKPMMSAARIVARFFG